MPPKNTIHKLPKSGQEVPDGPLRNAIDSMGEGFALFGPDDRLIFCNEAYLKLHPLGKGFIQPDVLFEDIIRENIKQGNVIVDSGDKEAYIKNRLKQHRNPKGPIYRRMADGASVVLNECRTPDGSTLLTLTNVTELREIEEGLRQSEERLRNAVSSLQEGFALYDADDRLVLFNDEYLRLHSDMKDVIKPGMLFEDMIRIHVERGLNADVTGKKEDYLRDRLEQHHNPKGPIVRTLTNGTSYLITESPTSDGGVVVTELDITEQQKTESALRDSEALARQMLEASPVGVLIATREGKHLFANNRALEIQGTSRKELFNSNAVSFYADPSERKRIKDKLYKTGNTPPTEVVLVKPDGAKYTVILTSTLVEFENQKAHLTYLYDITERKKTEAALKESEALLNDALESIADGVILLDKNDRFVFCNSSYRKFLEKIDHLLVPGTPFEEMVRSAAKSGLFWEGKGDIEGFVKKRMAIHRKRGTVIQRYAETDGWFIINEYKTSDGGTFIVRTDNTEQRKLEEKVEAEHARLMDAMESITDGVALFDKNDCLVLYNTAYQDSLRNLNDVLVPGVPFEDIVRAAAERNKAPGNKKEQKKYITRRMKEHREGIPTVHYYPDTDESVIIQEYPTSEGGIFLIRTDITELKQAEEALKASEERLTDITEAALDHFWEMGPDLRFTYLSDNFLGHTEPSSEVIIGKTPQEFIGPKTVNENPELWKAHQKDLEKHLAFRNFEFSKQFDDGNRRFYSVSGKPFFDKDGNFMGYRGAASDLTDYRRSEQELTHHKKMESLGYLAGGMAHNLNNMLLPILILGQMTKDRLPEESPDHQNLEIICRAAANAQELVARISGFSRQQGLDRKSADIYEIIHDGLSLIAAIVPPHITLKEDLDKNTGTVYLDSTQTQTVLINLIANAVDAMEGKEGALMVTLRKALVEETGKNFIPGLVSGVYAKLSVTDTGHGMDDETLNRIFDPFFTTKEVQKGTGLGLSTAFGSIHKHGGTIRASSTVGKGTTFDIYLPLE